MSANEIKEESKQPVQKFGTFLGVFTPSVLTILGLIMYLRFGWVIGNVGLPVTILIVFLASSITFITGLSASAIATNMRVGVGGEYFMISRSLGVELGGAIGIPLFLCRTLSITFYSFGIAESIVSFLPDAGPHTIQLLAAIIIIIITALSSKSAGMVLKLQIPIMAAVGLSLIALIFGVFSGDLRSPEMAITYRTAPEGFWYVFAVFFPAVTGFTAGIGMSGDLKDPQRSIPKGTLLAVATGSIVYIIILSLLSITARVSFAELAEPGIVWTKVAVLGVWLVYPGIWGAILSSAFGSVLAGPRVLQSLADDGLAPRFLARLSKTGQPSIATWISGAIALAAVALGELNTVAKFVSILFLTLYVIINLSSAIEKLVDNPSYRPTINVPWYISLLGAIGAILVMFLISPIACIAGVILEFLLYMYLRRRSLQKRWGDVRAGFWMALARFTLLQLRHHDSDPRNWRPLFLLFAGDAAKRRDLIRLVSWFNQDRGLITVCHLVVGDLTKENVNIEKEIKEMDRVLNREGIVAFSEVNVVSDFENGVVNIAQSKGIAGLKCNTIMFGWPNKKARLDAMLRIIRALSNTGLSTVITRLNQTRVFTQKKRIDIWWRGKQHNGDLMLLLAYLINLNPEWKKAKIIIRSIVADIEDHEVMHEFINSSLLELIEETRIQAEAEVVTCPSGKTITSVMHSYSRDADIVFIGLKVPDPGTEAEYAKQLIKLTDGFKAAILVRNAGEFAGNLI